MYFPRGSTTLFNNSLKVVLFHCDKESFEIPKYRFYIEALSSEMDTIGYDRTLGVLSMARIVFE